MPKQTLEDTTARTARFSTADFDCELPDEVRSELLRPKRATMLGRPPAPPKKRPWLDYARSSSNAAMLGLLGLVFIVALCSILSWSVGKHTTVPAPTPAQVQPTAAASPQPTASAMTAVDTWLAQAPVVKRAELVSVRRAERVYRLGEYHWVSMPDGTPVWARWLGVKRTFADLPHDPQLGDEWIVLEDLTRSPWVWYQLPNYPRAAWVDP